MHATALILWRSVAFIFVTFLLLSILLLLAIAINGLRAPGGESVTAWQYLGMLVEFASFQPIPKESLQRATDISQPLLIALGTIGLFFPLYALLRLEVRNFSGVVQCYTRSRLRNRKKLAKTLANRFRQADEICIVSGDFSWFVQDGEPGRSALEAILEHASRHPKKANIVSFKTRSAVEAALACLADEKRRQFIDLVAFRPHMLGVKLTIITQQDYRQMYMIAGREDGAEQTVIIRDRDYGRKLINTFQRLACEAA